MNGATYMADLIGGEKTGPFFDQRPTTPSPRACRAGATARRVLPCRRIRSRGAGGRAKSALASTAPRPRSTLPKRVPRPRRRRPFETRKADAFDALAELATRDGASEWSSAIRRPSLQPPGPRRGPAYERVAGSSPLWSTTAVFSPSAHAATRWTSPPSRGQPARRRPGRAVGPHRRDRWCRTGSSRPPYLAAPSYLKTVFLRLDA